MDIGASETIPRQSSQGLPQRPFKRQLAPREQDRIKVGNQPTSRCYSELAKGSIGPLEGRRPPEELGTVRFQTYVPTTVLGMTGTVISDVVIALPSDETRSSA